MFESFKDGKDLFQKDDTDTAMAGKGQLFAEGVAQTREGALCLKLKNTHSVNREYSNGGSQTFYCSNPHSGEKSICQPRVQWWRLSDI